MRSKVQTKSQLWYSAWISNNAILKAVTYYHMSNNLPYRNISILKKISLKLVYFLHVIRGLSHSNTKLLALKRWYHRIELQFLLLIFKTCIGGYLPCLSIKCMWRTLEECRRKKFCFTFQIIRWQFIISIFCINSLWVGWN